MDQHQTNTLFLFLALTIAQFVAYPVLTGGFPKNGDLFTVIIVLIISALLTCIYYLISDATRVPFNWNTVRQRYFASVIRVFIFIFFVGIFLVISIVVLISWAGMDKIKDIGIGIIGGIISGALILFIEHSFFSP